jgi:hypothetical protein
MSLKDNFKENPIVYSVIIIFGIICWFGVFMTVCEMVNAQMSPVQDTMKTCVLKGTVWSIHGDLLSRVLIYATCDTSFVITDKGKAWLYRFDVTETDANGYWELELFAGMTYRLDFFWRGQEYVEEHYYIPFCDSVWYGDSECIGAK